MEIKRTNSIEVVSNENLTDQQSLHSTSMQVEKKHVPPVLQNPVAQKMLASSRNQRIPVFMKATLKKSAAEEKEKSEMKDERQSDVGNIARSKVFQVRNLKYCEICEVEMHSTQSQLKMCECEHSFNFCQSCLHHYVIFKVKTFEEVFCPRDGCLAILNTNQMFFKQLPIDIQRNYNKLHQYYETSNDPTKKICPRENCEGLICTETERLMICNVCKGEYCGQCLLAAHEGECEKKEVEFFMNNLHYRRCKRCNFIIEKNQGCNHMTCRCRYQFCYVCGADWSEAHYSNHDQQGLPISNPAVAIGNRVAPVNIAPLPQETRCCRDCFCPFCGQLLKIIFKVIAFLLLPVFMAGLFAVRQSVIIAGTLILTILTGMFGFSFEILYYLKGPPRAIGIILFPVFMLGGIGLAFKQVFFVIVQDLFSHFWQIICIYSRWVSNL